MKKIFVFLTSFYEKVVNLKGEKHTHIQFFFLLSFYSFNFFFLFKSVQMNQEQEACLGHFLKYSLDDIDEISDGIKRITLPSISSTCLQGILRASSMIMYHEPTVLRLKTKGLKEKHSVLIIGDLHGHLLDLIRIIKTQGLPSETNKYVFLGDIVDRGEFSLETIVLVLLLMIKYKNHVYVVRGNHEFSMVCQQGSFFTEIVENYQGSDIFFDFMKCFATMPLACIIDDKFFCVHGGIGPEISSISDIEQIKKPLADFTNPVVAAILWSDPSDNVERYEPSSRGTGYKYGKVSLNEFLEKNNFECLIRAHECVEKGIESRFNNKCYTVFSASNYFNAKYDGTKGATLTITDAKIDNQKIYDPLNLVKRQSAMYVIPKLVQYQVSDEKNLLELDEIICHDKICFPKSKIKLKYSIQTQPRLPVLNSSCQKKVRNSRSKARWSTEIFRSESVQKFKLEQRSSSRHSFQQKKSLCWTQPPVF